MKPAKSGAPLSSAPFHVRAAIALGMWFGLNEVAPRGHKAPKSLVQLTEQLIDEATKTPLEVVKVTNLACRCCGCTDDRACQGGCYWVTTGLCSRCAERLGDEKRKRREKEKDDEFERVRARNDAHRAKRSRAGRSKR